jgi:hypothetical protein
MKRFENAWTGGDSFLIPPLTSPFEGGDYVVVSATPRAARARATRLASSRGVVDIARGREAARAMGWPAVGDVVARRGFSEPFTGAQGRASAEAFFI